MAVAMQIGHTGRVIFGAADSATDPMLPILVTSVTLSGKQYGVLNVVNSSSAAVVSTTATQPSAISVTTSSTTILAANANRTGFIIVNNSTQTIFVKLGSGASLADSIPIARGASWTMIGDRTYSGIITAIVAAGTADVRATELSP